MTTRQDYLDRRWTALILLCVSQFIVVLDASIVNVALPSIGRGLHAGATGLECSVREWAQRRGWSGRPVSQPIAGGILLATLGLLARHFGLTPRLRAA